MAIIWKVENNSGARASLVADGKRKHVWRPQTMRPDEFFHLLPEDKIIDDEALKTIFLMWQ